MFSSHLCCCCCLRHQTPGAGSAVVADVVVVVVVVAVDRLDFGQWSEANGCRGDSGCGGGGGRGQDKGELIRSVKKRIYFSFIGGACIGVFVTISLNFLTIARPVPGKTIHIKRWRNTSGLNWFTLLVGLMILLYYDWGLCWGDANLAEVIKIFCKETLQCKWLFSFKRVTRIFLVRCNFVWSVTTQVFLKLLVVLKRRFFLEKSEIT